MSDEQDYATLIEESLKDGSLGLKCRHCGESSWTYLELYRRYQCQVCGNQEGRIRQDEYNVESQQISDINEENIASDSNKGNKNNQDANNRNILNKHSGAIVAILVIFLAVLGAITYQQNTYINSLENESIALENDVLDAFSENDKINSINDSLEEQIQILNQEISELNPLKNDLKIAQQSLDEMESANINLQNSIEALDNQNYDLIFEKDLLLSEIRLLEEVKENSETIIKEKKLVITGLNDQLESRSIELSNLTSERDLLLEEIRIEKEAKENISEKLQSMLMAQPTQSEPYETEAYFNGHPDYKRSRDIHVQMNAQQELRGFVECDCNVRVQDFVGREILNLGLRVGERNFSFTAEQTGKYSILLNYEFSNAWAPYKLNYVLYTYYDHGD